MTDAGTTTARLRTLAIGAALVLATFATYHAALRQPLDSDARFLTYQNAFNQAPDGLARVWTSDFFQGAITYGVPYFSGYYRPLTKALFWVEYRVARDHAWVYHTTQLLLHALSGFLLFLLVSRLAGSWLPGTLAGLLFVLHPVNAFAASQPAARGDVLFAAFYLLALIVFDSAIVARGGARVAWRVALTAFLFLCSVLSKEMGITLPAALVLLVLFRRFERGVPWRWLLWTVPVWVAGAAYLVWRFALLHLPVSMPSVGYAAAYSSSVLVVAALKGVLIHLSRLVLPLWPTYPELNPQLVNYATTTWSDPLAYVAVPVVVLLVAAACLWRRHRALAFWSGLFLVMYSPLVRVDNIAGTLALNVFLTQERWIYLPGIAVIAGIGVAVARRAELVRARPQRLLLGALASVVLVVLGHAASLHAGRHVDAFAELRRLYLQPDERLSRFERANKLLLYADWVAMPMGDTAEAEARARRAVQLVPDSPISLMALANILARQGKWSEAAALMDPWLAPPMKRLLEIKRTNPRVGDDVNRISVFVPHLLGRAAAHLGDGPRAAALFCEAVRRGVDRGQIAKGLRELYALDGPPRCLAGGGDVAACVARVPLPADSPLRPPFAYPDCRSWAAEFRR